MVVIIITELYGSHILPLIVAFILSYMMLKINEENKKFIVKVAFLNSGLLSFSLACLLGVYNICS
jgi:hypothetical protein